MFVLSQTHAMQPNLNVMVFGCQELERIFAHNKIDASKQDTQGYDLFLPLFFFLKSGRTLESSRNGSLANLSAPWPWTSHPREL